MPTGTGPLKTLLTAIVRLRRKRDPRDRHVRHDLFCGDSLPAFSLANFAATCEMRGVRFLNKRPADIWRDFKRSPRMFLSHLRDICALQGVPLVVLASSMLAMGLGLVTLISQALSIFVPGGSVPLPVTPTAAPLFTLIGLCRGRF